MSCDDANAFYDADLNEIQFCYEYVKFYYDLKADELEAAGEDDTVAAGEETTAIAGAFQGPGGKLRTEPATR